MKLAASGHSERRRESEGEKEESKRWRRNKDGEKAVGEGEKGEERGRLKVEERRGQGDK